MKRPFYQNPFDRDISCQCIITNMDAFDAHWHSEIEIVYVISGSICFMAEGKTYRLHTGEAIYFGCAETHEVLSTTADNRMLVMEMGYGLLGSLFQFFTEITLENRIILSADTPCVPLEELFVRLYTHMDTFPSQPDPVKLLRMHALMYDIAATLLECCSFVSLTGERSRHVRDFMAMHSVLDYVWHHYQESLDVVSVAHMVGYEKTRFCHLFRRATGDSFHRYVNRYRLEKARKLLAETDRSISSAAEAVGFNDVQTLTRLFKTYYGITPTEFRKTIL